MTRAPHRHDDEIPTSSMADIAFLLVVYFMVTMTLAVTRGLDFAMPKTPPENTVETVDSVLVEVLPGGRLVVDRRPMTADEMFVYLEPKLRQRPDKPVILQTSPDAAYGDMVATFDLLRRGRERLGLGQELQIAVPTERETAAFWQ